jgi:hypothetical protein
VVVVVGCVTVSCVVVVVVVAVGVGSVVVTQEVRNAAAIAVRIEARIVVCFIGSGLPFNRKSSQVAFVDVLKTSCKSRTTR